MSIANVANSGVAKQDTLRVLIVDDNFASAQTIGWMIEMLGHEIRLAHNAQNAIEAVSNYTPDLVLLDIGLPGTSGYEVCKQMKKIPSLDKTMFVAQTGWGSEEHKQKSKEAGFTYHLVKPVTIQMLEPVLASASNRLDQGV